jgi:hypothetical protein
MTFIRFPLTARSGKLLLRFPLTPSTGRSLARKLAVGLGLCLSVLAVLPPVTAQNPVSYIPATAAFNNSPAACSDTDLSADPTIPDLDRGNPEWKPIVIDPNHPLPNNPPTILEGFVPFPPANEGSNAQAPAEVSEEELPWNHYTHDFTFKVAPDPGYQQLLSSWVRFPGFSIPGLFVIPPEICPDLTTGMTCHHTEMEVEWENGSVMKVNDDDDRTWGAVPEFVWPSSGDRVWVEGRWIFDCGHPGSDSTTYVKFASEIHPPRALVTLRLNHPALSDSPGISTSPASWLPVTGAPATVPLGQPNSGPTNVPVTEADIFVSGNGGGANDLCALEHGCPDGHTNPVLSVNDRNYVFDIYPQGTTYVAPLLADGTYGPFPVTPPVPDASLQWRTIDQSGQLPAHACSSGASPCVTVNPIFCPIDASTPPPPQDQTLVGISCPAVPAHPTRLRVILPFCGPNPPSCVSSANYFAQSILLGWDDVPAPATINRVVRTFKVTLHALTVVGNGEGCSISNGCVVPVDGDWRVFVGVAGQWRYMSPLFDGGPGNNACNGDALTENGDGDCFLFDGTPWIVSVQDGTPIHVAVGGFDSDSVDSDYCGAPDNRFRYPGGCPIVKWSDAIALGLVNDDRIGTYDFDLQEPHDYQWILPDGTTNSFYIIPSTNNDQQYKVEFVVQEIPAATAPVSAPLGIGTPNFGQFVSSITPLTLSTASTDTEGFQYRSYLQGGPLPTYPFLPTQPYPVHWTHADLPAGSQSVPVFLSGADGPNLLQYSAESFGQLLEPRHTTTLKLDNTPPVISIAQPQATTYPHCGVLTLTYTVDDGTGSGVASFTPTMDGRITLPGGVGLQSGQPINLLTELALGTHTFSVTATDNVNNTSATSVTFTIIVTADSIKCDVTELLSAGCIDDGGISSALTSKLSAAQAAISRGNIQTAINTLTALKNQISAQAGKHIATSCAIGGVGINPATILLLDVQALIDSLKVSTIADPITGYVVNASDVGVPGATLSILDAGGNTVATASTDITGYYFFATTGVLAPGSSYTVTVTGLPAGFLTSTPAASPVFAWAGTGMMIGNFVLN